MEGTSLRGYRNRYNYQKEGEAQSGYTRKSLRSGQFVFILDGFDEVYAAYKKPLLLSLDEFIDIYPDNNYIVTSRPETGIESFPRLKRF